MKRTVIQLSSDSQEGNIGRGRGVQFGGIGSIVLSDEPQELGEEEIEDEPEEYGFASWNERMRHQEQIRAQQAKIHEILDGLLTKLFVVVLERCLESIAILRETHGLLPAPVNLDYVPITVKYNQVDYDLQTEITLDEAYLDLEKMRYDMSWIEKVLSVTILNLRKSWNFDDLVTVLNDHKAMEEDKYNLLTAKNFNQKELCKLRQSQEAERDVLVTNIQRITEQLGNLKDELNDLMAEYDVKVRVLKKWEAARYEQNTMILQNQEKSYIDTSQTMAVEIAREDRVHEEMDLFLDEAQKDAQDAIEYWMDKYDNEIDQWEISINQRRLDVDNMKEDYQNLLDKYEDRKFQMEEYMQHKLEKQREAEELARRVEAAMKIQSWWRGIMFRRGLGPWRRKKGKGRKGSGRKGSGRKSSGKKGSAKNSAKKK